MQRLTRILFYFSFLSVIILTGCTQKYQYAGATIKEAFSVQRDIAIPKEKIQNLPYASVFVTINGRGRIFMVLAFSDRDSNTESPTLKWLSADNAMIATKDGRIIKTMGFTKDNLAQLTSNKQMPPSRKAPPWQATYDWAPGYRYNFRANITTHYLGKETISTELWKKETTHIEENVYFPTLDSTFQSQFWLDSDNQVVKTIQYLGPNMDKVEILFIKPYLEPASH